MRKNNNAEISILLKALAVSITSRTLTLVKVYQGLATDTSSFTVYNSETRSETIMKITRITILKEEIKILIPN